MLKLNSNIIINIIKKKNKIKINEDVKVFENTKLYKLFLLFYWIDKYY